MQLFWKKTISLFFIGLLTFCLLFPSIADAEPPFSFTTYIEVKEEYNDNVYLTEDDKTRDIIHCIAPGFEFSFNTPKSHIDMNYELRVFEYENYEHNDGLDTTDENYVGHELNLEMESQIFPRLLIGLEDAFIKSRRPSDMAGDILNRASRAKYWRNQVAPYLQYKLGKKLFLLLKYRHENLDYDETRFAGDEDSKEDRGYLTFEYQFNTKNSIDLDYQFWVRDYDYSTTYRANQVTLGYKRAFSSILTGEIRGGYQNRNFDHEIEDVVSDWDGFVGKLSLEAKTSKSKGVLSFERDMTGVGEGEDYFVAWRVSFEGSYDFGDKLTFSLMGAYQNSDYEEERVYWHLNPIEREFKTRGDDFYSGGASIKYAFYDWLSLELLYIHNERDSNIREEDYEEDRAFMIINASYDL